MQHEGLKQKQVASLCGLPYTTGLSLWLRRTNMHLNHVQEAGKAAMGWCRKVERKRGMTADVGKDGSDGGSPGTGRAFIEEEDDEEDEAEDEDETDTTRNTSLASRKKSLYLGVSQARWRGNADTQIFSQKWCPRIKHLGKDIHLGSYVHEEGEARERERERERKRERAKWVLPLNCNGTPLSSNRLPFGDTSFVHTSLSIGTSRR
jgi:hypothetical protein